MFRILLLTLFMIVSLNAKTITEDYSVEFGIIGEIAKVHATMKIKKNHYVVDANLIVIGAIANKVTEDLKERHISKGHIVKGKYITDMYQMIKSYGKINSTTIYKTNHKKKTVSKQYKKWKNGKLIIDKTVKLKYYATNDLVNIFLNLPRYKKQKVGKNYNRKVVGADRKNGSVLLTIPTKKQAKVMKNLLGKIKKVNGIANLLCKDNSITLREVN